MNMTDSASSTSLWAPDNLILLSEVKKNNLEFRVDCSLPAEQGYEDVTLTGRLAHVAGSSVLFEILEREKSDHKARGHHGCEISFVLDKEGAEGGNERVGYSGHGRVVEIEEGKNGAPLRLLLHLSSKFAARRLRKDRRVKLDAEKIRMLCLIAVPEEPTQMDYLRDLLTEYCKHVTDGGRFAPELVDIAASGACLRMQRATNRREFDSHEYLLLFLAVDSPADNDKKPYILLAKKVGIGKDKDPAYVSLRLRFDRELDANKSQVLLCWADINKFGSERLRNLILRVTKEDAEERKAASAAVGQLSSRH